MRENIQPTPPHLIPITPDMIDNYLKQKYLDTWNELLDRGLFTKTEFCTLINNVRSLRIQRQEPLKRKIQEIENKTSRSPDDNKRLKELKDKKNAIMNEAINEIFNPIIQQRIITSAVSRERVYGLIGSVLHIQQKENKDIEESIKKSQSELSINLNDSNLHCVEDILDAIEKRKEDFKNSNIGNALNEDEEKSLAEEELTSFRRMHDAEIQQGTIDMPKIIKYLHQTNIL